jgi:hypothetical protein
MGVQRPGKVTKRALAGVLAGAIAVSAGVALGHPQSRSATPSAKVISGTPKADRLIGTGHHDVINGLGGNDVINGRAGRDRLNGGPGNDVIHARDGTPDVIDCGPGRDHAIVDRTEDGVYNCERVKAPKPGRKRGAG